jgi:peptide/nickel transport system substrate-binding protein
VGRAASAFALVWWAVLASCIPGATVPDATRSPEERPTPGGRIVFGSPSDIAGLNPVIFADPVSTEIAALLYEPLVRPNPKTGEPMAWLGKWSLATDNVTYTWEIDARADWSDGRPILAQDWVTRVKATARSRLTTEKNILSEIEGFRDYADGRKASIEGITIEPANPKRFTVKLLRPFCPALLYVFGVAPLPTHVFGKYALDDDPSKNLDAAPENAAPKVSSGPFTFKEWRKGEELVLAKNPGYWRGAPHVDEFVMRVVPTAAQAAELKSGRVTVGLVRPADFDDLSKQPNLKVYEWPDNAYEYIGWRLTNPGVAFLQDKRIRQALAYGLDTGQAVGTILLGHGQRRVAHLPAFSWASAASGLEEYRYDPARAEQLIRDAGYAKGSDGFYQKDGRTLGLAIVTNQGNSVREAFQTYAVDQYRKIGVKIATRNEAFESLSQKLASGSTEVEAFLVGWQLGPDPDMHAIWHSANVARATQYGNNFAGFADARLDSLLEQGRGPDCARDARRDAYAQANRLLNEEQPYNFGFSQNRILVTDSRIRSIDPGSYSPNAMWNIEKWWIKR